MFDITPIISDVKNDCGATCLKMLLSYYGVDVDLDTLTQECNTRIIGCSGKDLLRVGRLHGLDDIQAFKMDAEELIAQDRPSIIWWRHGHWCVCCGTDDDRKVVVCNPDMGRYRMGSGVFKSFYSGVAIFNGEPVTVE